MRLILLFASGLTDLVALLGKWLFIVVTPVLLIVAGSYYQTGHSLLEPLLGLALVSGVFMLARLLSARLHDAGPVGRNNAAVSPESTAGLVFSSAEIWNLHLEEDGRKQVDAKEETCLANQRQAELWKQANPWGGYNPHW
ncbi:MAG: hypothetical protein WAW42_16195 [Candidatus Competibacteraceae bacterium]